MSRLSPASRAERTHVKFMFVMMSSPCAHNYYISILDDSFNYSEHSLNMKQDALTYNGMRRLSKFMNKWLIDRNSEIVFMDDVSISEPLHMYLETVNKYIFANFRHVSLDQIVKRISTYHSSYLAKKASKVSARNFTKLWKKLLKNEPCPWINKTTETALQLYSFNKQVRLKRLKVATYYLAIKRHMMGNV